MRTLLAAAAAFLLLAAPATASSVRIASGALVYSAVPGEANDLVLEPGPGVIAVTDAGATIAPGAGCRAVSRSEATCTAAGVTRQSATLLDRGDRARVLTALPATIDGGSEDDRLTGGAAADVLRGGTGHGDRLAGGAGDDRLSDPPDPGPPSFLVSPSLSGGDGADTIDGSGRISGGPGPDTLSTAGAAELFGDAGDDVLTGGLQRGGSGADTMRPGLTGTVVDYATLSGAGGPVSTVGRRVSLDGVADDGRPASPGVPAERDNVLPGVEELRLGDGDDVVTGSARPERFRLGHGDNSVAAGGGDDWIEGGENHDGVSGGTGTDLMSYAEHLQGVTVTLDGQANDGGPSESDDVEPDVENVEGTPEADHLTGSGAPNVLVGGAGGDTVLGLGGADRLCAHFGAPEPGGCSEGPPASDRLDGGEGDDTLVGSRGATDLRGGAGTDTVDYASKYFAPEAVAGVTVRLDDVAGDGVAGEGDNVRADVENLIGTDRADHITGTSTPAGGSLAVANVIDPGAGEDDVRALGGNDLIVGAGTPLLLGSDDDRLSGGTGVDTVSYEDAFPEYGIEVSLDGLPNDGVGGMDDGENVLPDVEALIGTEGPDVLVGSSSRNRLQGLDGADRLEGAGGDDTIAGGEGLDVLLGGDGLDFLDARDGAEETVHCGAGAADRARLDATEAGPGCETISRP